MTQADFLEQVEKLYWKHDEGQLNYESFKSQLAEVTHEYFGQFA